MTANFSATDLFADTISLSKYVKQILVNGKHPKIFKLEESYEAAKENYKKALTKYNLKLSYSYNNSGSQSPSRFFQGDINYETNSSFAASKKFPFLFGNDLDITFANSYSDIASAMNNLIPESQSLSFIYSLPLTFEGIKASEYNSRIDLLNFEKSIIDYVSKKEDLMVSLVNDYMVYINAMDNFEESNKQLESQKRLLEFATAKYDLGEIPGIELIRSKVSMINEEHRFSETKNDYLNKKKEIYWLLGYPETKEINFDRNLDIDFEIKPVEYFLSRLKFNKDYQLAVRELETARIDYLSVMTQQYPDLLLKAAQITTKEQDSFKKDSHMSYGFALAIPIIDSSLDNDYRIKQKKYKDLEDNFKNKTDAIHHDIVTKYNRIMSYKEDRELLGIYYEYALSEYNIVMEQYDKGNANQIDVEHALASLEDVRGKLFQNRKNYIIANFELNKFAGLNIPTDLFISIK